jgi:RNA polymerase sigma factor (sigma-70 family)
MNNVAMNTNPKPSGELGEYLKSITANSRITSDEEVTLALAWRDHECQVSRDKLITANLRLVIMVAKRYMNRGIPLDDLVAEGNVGLIHAVDNFDPRAGAKLSTYAVYWIRHAITEAFSHASRRSRMTRVERTDLASMEKSHASFVTAHGRQPSAQELCAELHWHPEKLRTIETMRTARSRPQSLSDGGSITLELAATTAKSHHSDETATRSSRIHRMLDALTPDERRIIELRFGLDGASARPIGQIAENIGEAPRVVRVRLETAMRKLTRLAAVA